MQILVDQTPFQQNIAPERRDLHQQPDREAARVVACNGARATISTVITDVPGTTSEIWSIGRLISIANGNSRLVGLIYEMRTAARSWEEGKPNTMLVEVELVGEVVPLDNGRSLFRRGISTYPVIGAHAHRIRATDLALVHDLGDRSSVVIGTLSQDDSIPATVCIEDMLSRHFAVLGTTGVGKSSAVALLLRRCVEAKRNLRVLILDPHNEYARAFPDNSIRIDASSLDLPFWMFRFDEFSDVVFRGRPSNEEEVDILRDMIAAAKSRYKVASTSDHATSLLRKQSDGGSFTADSPVPYRINDLIGLIDEMIGLLEPRYNRSHLRALKVRVEGLYNDPRYRFMFAKAQGGDTSEQVIGQIFRIPHEGRPITVFQLAGLPSEVVNSVASVLARLAFDLALWSHGRYEILLLCEEAHRYVPEDHKSGFGPTRTAIAKIAKEGRKYGCYLGIITQRPGELDPTILSQCSTVFAMRLANDRDQQIIRSAIADSSASTISFLSSIGNREAIAFGEGIAMTMRMRFETIAQRHLPLMGTQVLSEGAPLASHDVTVYDIMSRMRASQNHDRAGF